MGTGARALQIIEKGRSPSPITASPRNLWIYLVPGNRCKRSDGAPSPASPLYCPPRLKPVLCLAIEGCMWSNGALATHQGGCDGGLAVTLASADGKGPEWRVQSLGVSALPPAPVPPQMPKELGAETERDWLQVNRPFTAPQLIPLPVVTTAPSSPPCL